MSDTIKLIEGMKKLKVIEKKIEQNTARVQQYASAPSNEKAIFGDESAQRHEVGKLIQANTDLTTEYLILKRRIDMTNLTTEVTIGKKTYKLVDLLVLRRGLAKKMQATYDALNTSYADDRLRSMRNSTVPGEKAPTAVRFYDETAKYEAVQGWQNLQDEIEQRLETVNALTDLVTLE